MTTILELIDTGPAAGDGLALPFSYDSGAWRSAFQIADPSAGAAVVWHDLTSRLYGYNVPRGAGSYDGRFEATVANIELKGVAGDLAPYNSDTSPMFGTHVELGPGLLVRYSWFRVVGGVVVEWLPRFTLKVENWGDAAHARGSIRRHPIVARDTFTSLVDVPVTANDEEDWSDRVVNILSDAGWPYGLLAYHDFDLLLPARAEQSSASTELDATLDPVGLVWYTDRYGHLVIRPRAGDTLHGPVLPQPTVHFSYLADPGTSGLIAYATDTAVAEPIGISKSELGVKNVVVITSPTGTFTGDDAISIQRFDPKVHRATWLAANDLAADQFLAYRKFAQYEATPFLTTIGQQGFHDLLLADFLSPAEIDHKASAGEPAVNATGVVRRLEESARFMGELAVDMAIRTTVDVDTASDVVFMLPVEDLAADTVGDTAATFSWTNPGGQPVTPTHTQVRLIGATTIWSTLPYPIVALEWTGLAPGTAYQLQVRLVEIVADVITTVSPVRVVNITTTNLTTPGGGDGSGDVDVPDYGACDTDWRLYQWDGDAWDLIASGTVASPPVDVSAFLTPGGVYRVESRENCSGVTGPWVVGPSWIEPDDWGDPCMTPPALSDPPFDDPDLIAYVPQLCAPATIREAVSHNEAEKGPSFGLVTVDDDGHPQIWSNAQGRTLQGYAGVELATLEDDSTLTWRGKLGTQPSGTVVLASFGSLEIRADADGAGFGVSAVAYEQTGGATSIFGSTELPLDTETFLNLVHDVGADTLTLYVRGVVEVSAVGTVGLRDFADTWYCDLPADSWFSDVAVFGRVLAPAELPGFQAAPTVTINKAAGQADPASGGDVLFDVVFSEAVTGFSTGDVTLSGTAGATTGVVAGSGTTYTVTVSGMTTSGTVIAAIAASVATGTVSALPNDASTSSDNSVQWNLVYTDDFNRANNGNIPDASHPWIEITGRTGMAILGNQLVGPGTTAASWAFWNIDLGSADHFIELDLIAGFTQSLMVRGASAGPTEPATYYETSWSAASGGRFVTRKFAAGTPTTINTTTGVGTLVANDRVRFQIQGTTLKVYVNGVQKVSFTDATIAAGRYVGIRNDSQSSPVDNMSCGPL